MKGQFPLQDFLRCQPLEAITQQFFSPPNISIDNIIEVLKPFYDEPPQDWMTWESHSLFVTKTLPDALKTLAQKHDGFLVDFIFFVTGFKCLPYMKGKPDFKLQILFEGSMTNDHLPQSHTCENLMHVPWQVYDNDSEFFARKLHKAVENSLVAGFDMG